jgi:large subunit ribosomal protein L24e
MLRLFIKIFLTMVIKTEPCAFTEFRIYPGHGKKFASKDGKTHFFINSKAAAFYHRKTKPVKLTWTQSWRRYNKKGKVEEASKRRTKRTTRVEKAIVGLTLEEIRRRKQNTEKKAIREQAEKELKDKKKKQIEAKKAEKSRSKVAAPKAPKAEKQPKKAAPAAKKGGR